MFAKFSVKKPLTVFVAVVLVIVLGFVSFSSMTPDLLPSINLPYAIVITTYPGATPEEVETEITKPLEQQLATLENIESVSSTSAENVSQIILQFAESANMDAVVPNIREKINGVSSSWDDLVGTPYILKLNPDMLPVTVAAVKMEGMNNIELTNFLDEELLSYLEGINGVASVSLSGTVSEQINIVLSQEKIDKVNNKIQNTVLDKFDEAEDEIAKNEEELNKGIEELEEQKEKLESAENQLESGKSELTNKTSEAEAELIHQRAELAETQAQLEDQLRTAELTKSALVELSKALKDVRTALYATTDEVDNKISAVEEEIANYSSHNIRKSEIQIRINLLESNSELSPEDEAELNSLKAELAIIEADIINSQNNFALLGTSYDNAAEYLIELNTERAEIIAKRSAAEASLSALGVEKENLDSTIKETDDGIAQLESGIAQINDALVQINDGSLTIKEAIAELNRQQLMGMLEISSGLSQIISAKSTITMAETQLDSAKDQLDAAKDQIDSQKESALDSAKVDINMTLISQILMAQNFSMPAGYISEGGIDYMVKIGDELEDLDELKDLLLFDIDGVGEVRLSDVAEVYISDNSASVYAKLDYSDGIILSFSKQSEYATATVSENIAKRLEELSDKYEGLSFVNLSDQGDYIDLIVDTVLENLYLGAIFAVLILLIFLKDIKPTLVVACSIPVSLLFAIVLMYFSGITLNVISLSGLAIGIGMLVDNSIVVIENIYRMRSLGESSVRAAVYGTKQVAGAIAASTLTTVCVFLPIVFVEGLTRQIFADMALTIGYSLLASLIVAITLVPALSAKLINKPMKERPERIFNWFIKVYGKAAEFSLSHKWICIVLSIVLLVTSTVAVLAKGFIYMPSMSGQQISITVTVPENTEFEETKKIADEVMNRILEIEDIETVGGFTGGTSIMTLSSSLGASSSDPTSVSMYAIISESSGKKDSDISKIILEKCEDLDCEVTATGAMDLSSMMGALGGGNAISITLYSDDLDLLAEEADRIALKVAELEEIESVSNGLGDTTPEFRIIVDKDKAMAKGLTVAQVYTYVAAELSSEATATSVNIEGTNIDAVVYASENDKELKDIKNLTIEVTSMIDGSVSKVKLSSIADFVETVSLNSIQRDIQRRYISVSANIKEGYNITNTANVVENYLKDYELPAGITMEIGGQSNTIMDAVGQLFNMLLLAVAIIYLIMVAQFQSLKSPFIVMFTIPLAFTGGFIALLMFGFELSIVSLVGFIMLSGIIVNNGIVLIDYINTLRISGMEKREAILTAGKTRMRPILMTALTTVMGLVFMAAANGLGSELMQPVALVCIGGLLYATLMTLFVIPALYDIFNKKELKKVIIDEEDEKEEITVV